MPIDLIAKLPGAPPATLSPRWRDADEAIYGGSRMGTWYVRADRELRALAVPEPLDYVAVRMPFTGQGPTSCYLPERLAYRYHCPPAGVAWSHKPLTFPGTAHAPCIATCGPNGGTLLGCLDHDRTVELFASNAGIELRFAKPDSKLVARLAAWSLPGMVNDVGIGLDAFLQAWGGPAEPECFESEPLIIDINTQDVPDEKLAAVVQKIIDDHAGLADTVIVWGAQDDPQRRCCEPIIPLRAIAQNAIEAFKAYDWRVLPYTRPDGADLQKWFQYLYWPVGCTSTYIDHVPGCSPEQIRPLNGLSGIIEWPTLALPGFGVLASGCISGGGEALTYPDGTPHPSTSGNITPWPEQGRRLFPRTALFFGTQNSDAQWWNVKPEPHVPAYAIIRRAWLLGGHFVPRPQPYPDGRQWGMNPCLMECLSAYYTSRWFHRKPKWGGVVRSAYPGVRASWFTGSSGETMLLWDRWDDLALSTDVTVDANGKTFTLPAGKRIGAQ